jgi:hypothetical protein
MPALLASLLGYITVLGETPAVDAHDDANPSNTVICLKSAASSRSANVCGVSVTVVGYDLHR